MRRFALIFFIITVIFISGCIQQPTQQPTGRVIIPTEESKPQPQETVPQPQSQYNPCQNIVCNDYCSNNLRYHNGYCSDGICHYSSENCVYGCKNNRCVECKNVQESYTEQVPYYEKESYQVTIPYNVTEPYYEKESYQVNFNFSILDSSLKEYWNLQYGYYYEYKVTVFNGDDNTGSFLVIFTLQTSKHGTLTDTKSYMIQGKGAYTFISIFDTDMGEQVSGSYKVVPPTKTEYRTITKYHDVTYYKTETRYKDVLKYKTETRYRTVLVCNNQTEEKNEPKPTPQPTPTPTPSPQLKSFGSYCTYNSDCSSGYCVHNYCRYTSTYCEDGYCDSGETCSSCPTDCGVCPSQTSKITPEQEIYNFVNKIKGIENIKDGAKIAIYFDECFDSDYFIKKQNGQIIVEKKYKGQTDYDLYLWIYCDYYKQIKDNSNICPLSIDKNEAYFNTKYCDEYCLFSKGYCALKSCMGSIEAFKSCP